MTIQEQAALLAAELFGDRDLSVARPIIERALRDVAAKALERAAISIQHPFGEAWPGYLRTEAQRIRDGREP